MNAKRRTAAALALTLLLLVGCGSDKTSEWEFTLVVHGGAGTIRRAEMTPDRERTYRQIAYAALTESHRSAAPFRELGSLFDEEQRFVPMPIDDASSPPARRLLAVFCVRPGKVQGIPLEGDC